MNVPSGIEPRRGFFTRLFIAPVVLLVMIVTHRSSSLARHDCVLPPPQSAVGRSGTLTTLLNNVQDVREVRHRTILLFIPSPLRFGPTSKFGNHPSFYDGDSIVRLACEIPTVVLQIEFSTESTRWMWPRALKGTDDPQAVVFYEFVNQSVRIGVEFELISTVFSSALSPRKSQPGQNHSELSFADALILGQKRQDFIRESAYRTHSDLRPFFVREIEQRNDYCELDDGQRTRLEIGSRANRPQEFQLKAFNSLNGDPRRRKISHESGRTCGGASPSMGQRGSLRFRS